MEHKLTIAIEKGKDGWYVGYLEELPSVMSQGKTIDELKENILDALELFLEVQQEETKKMQGSKKIFRRKLELI